MNKLNECTLSFLCVLSFDYEHYFRMNKIYRGGWNAFEGERINHPDHWSFYFTGAGEQETGEEYQTSISLFILLLGV